MQTQICTTSWKQDVNSYVKPYVNYMYTICKYIYIYIYESYRDLYIQVYIQLYRHSIKVYKFYRFVDHPQCCKTSITKSKHRQKTQPKQQQAHNTTRNKHTTQTKHEQMQTQTKRTKHSTHQELTQ